MSQMLAGKACPLDAALARMRQALARLDIMLETDGWHNPVPHVWSVHVRARECPALFANGKGISREAALASAFGEFLERWMTGYFFADYALPDDLSWRFVPEERAMAPDEAWAALPGRLRRLYEQAGSVEAAHLASLATCDDRATVLPLQSARTGETVWFPWNLLVNLYASNGLAAGSTALEARIQALSEICERWVRMRIIMEDRCLPQVPEAVLAQFPRVVAAREALAALGIEIDVRDASLGEGWPVVAIILYEQGGGRTFVSFGAHPILEVAVERTLTEAFQGRALDRLEGWQPPAYVLEWVQDEGNMEAHFVDASGLFHWRFFEQPDTPWSAWGCAPDAPLAVQWRQLVERLEAAGFELFSADYQLADFHACRLVVPGMSEVFSLASWLEDDHSAGCGLRQCLQAGPLDRPQRLAALQDALACLDVADHAPATSVLGLMCHPDNPWRQVRMGDLRLWTAAALGEVDVQTAAGLHEDLMALHAQDAPVRAAHLAALWRLTGLDEAGWQARQPALRRLYGDTGLQWARAGWAGTVLAQLPVGDRLYEDPWHRALWSVLKATRGR